MESSSKNLLLHHNTNDEEEGMSNLPRNMDVQSSKYGKKVDESMYLSMQHLSFAYNSTLDISMYDESHA